MPNAFDFGSEVAAEEKAKKEDEVKKKEAILADVRRSSTMHIRPSGEEGEASSDSNKKFAKSGGGLFSAGGGAATAAQGAANLSKSEQQAKMESDRKAKKFAKLYGEPEEPKMKVLTLEMMELQRKNAAKKKRAARREAVLESLKNKGVDDGKGAQKLLTSSVDEVLSVEKPNSPNRVPEYLTEKKSWQDCSFF